jgi:hypothetical protein
MQNDISFVFSEHFMGTFGHNMHFQISDLIFLEVSLVTCLGASEDGKSVTFPYICGVYELCSTVIYRNHYCNTTITGFTK